MVFVGLMGGASFVNVIYLIKRSEHLHKTERELALNLATVCNDIGTLSACITALVLSVTTFSEYTSD